MTDICVSAIHLCAVRATRLDAVGNPEAGPNNVYVSNNPLMVTATPVIETGTDKTVVGGCDCIVATYRGTDKFKRVEFAVDFTKFEPAMLELLTGGEALLNESGDVIGIGYPNQVSCDDPSQPNVAFEGFQTLWEDDHPLAAPYKYLHWVWPSTFWQWGPTTLQNEFDQFGLTGYSRGNPQWAAADIYHDLPANGIPDLGGCFYDDDIPAASCGYQSHAIT